MTNPPPRACRLGAVAAAALAVACAAATPRDRAPTQAERGGIDSGAVYEGGADATATRPPSPNAAELVEGRGTRSSPRYSRPRYSRERADAGELRDAVAAARRALVAAVSTATRPAYGAPAALRAISELIHARTREAPAAARSLARMSDEIDALDRLAAVDLDRADRVRAALDAGVEAARAIAIADQGADWLGEWIAVAASAAARVDPAVPLGLQRAAVQDALRTLLDALVVAAELAPRGDGAAGAAASQCSCGAAGSSLRSSGADRIVRSGTLVTSSDAEATEIPSSR